MTTARSRPRPPASKRGGFSLPEVLFALLLMALSSSTLLHYHRALALGFSQQWYQREAWRVAEQQLMGHESPGWTSILQQQSGPSGCTLDRADVTGPYQRRATLTRLRC
ncbi:prepilin-type N-terminal cleavage/methylation domain-containing protein [Pantoea agglomerans]|nr:MULTISPECIES: prepilin-type N-terminal cleavage/methylation domain-containing protein [Pantoea]MCX2201809.1 prepilin-type N-terminal cleavage/methylation domain-containing protein [Pantoea agglomerans]UJQ24734.1 prepilin-type N-terminal cleavage/methylation domain-containing protein [Pantoea agglomerans]